MCYVICCAITKQMTIVECQDEILSQRLPLISISQRMDLKDVETRWISCEQLVIRLKEQAPNICIELLIREKLLIEFQDFY